MHHVYHQYVIRLTDEFPMKRADFIEYLKAKGIGSAVHYPIPLHHQPVYARANEPDSCPGIDQPCIICPEYPCSSAA